MASFDQRHQTVLQQLNADTINIILSNLADTRTRQWRPLLQVRYPVSEDSQLSRGRFYDDVFIALNDAFENFGYIKFTTLISLATTKGSDGNDYIIYSLLGHQITFLDALRKRAVERLKAKSKIADTIRNLEGEAKVRALEKLNEEYLAKHSKLTNWNRLGGIVLGPKISAMELEYDPNTRTVIFRSFEEPLFDPAEYPDHLARTSELLRWVASWYDIPAGYFGNIKWFNENPRMLKLMIFILDHAKVDFHSIRVDATDYEKWDFLYPAFEEEMIAYGTQADFPKP